MSICACLSPLTSSPIPLAQQLCFAAREHVVGWYSTGPRLREADLSIHQLMSNYVSTPVLVICEVEVRSQLRGGIAGKALSAGQELRQADISEMHCSRAGWLDHHSF